MTHARTYGKAARVAREKEFPERITLPMEAGTSARLDALITGKETRVGIIREAIAREIKRRERQK